MGTRISPCAYTRGAGVGLAASLTMLAAIFASGAAFAADLGDPDGYSFKDPVMVEDEFRAREYLFGDWGGARTRWKAMGIDVTLSGVNEVVGNVSGGASKEVDQASQLALGMKFDMDKLAGWQGGTFGVTLSDRFGHNHADHAGIPALQLDNEVFGRGNIVRLTEFYYKQMLFDDRVWIKGGRLPVGSDFFFQHCDFTNLTLCGGQPGNIAGDYIFNWPISQWGAVVNVKLGMDLAFQVGVYDRSDEYLSTKGNIALLPSVPGETVGALIPVELQYSPHFGNLKPGDWRVGAVYSTEDSVDVNGRNQSGRSVYYFSITQALNSTGLTGFVNGSFADDTEVTDRQINVGLIQHGTFSWRPNDEVAIGYGQTHVNSDLPGRDTEHVIEAWYGIQATGWMMIRLDAQWIHNPGGFSDKTLIPDGFSGDDAVILGLKTTINF